MEIRLSDTVQGVKSLVKWKHTLCSASSTPQETQSCFQKRILNCKRTLVKIWNCSLLKQRVLYLPNSPAQEFQWVFPQPVISFIPYDLVPLITPHFTLGWTLTPMSTASPPTEHISNHVGTALSAILLSQSTAIFFCFKLPAHMSWSWKNPFPHEVTHCPFFISSDVRHEEHSKPFIQAEHVSLQASMRGKERCINSKHLDVAQHVCSAEETILSHCGTKKWRIHSHWKPKPMATTQYRACILFQTELDNLYRLLRDSANKCKASHRSHSHLAAYIPCRLYLSKSPHPDRSLTHTSPHSAHSAAASSHHGRQYSDQRTESRSNSLGDTSLVQKKNTRAKTISSVFRWKE